MLRRTVLLAVVGLLAAGLAMAEGELPVKVTAIGVSPSSVTAGDMVTIMVTLKNEGAALYGCLGHPNWKVRVWVWKLEPNTTRTVIWSGEQAVPFPLQAGQSRALPLTAKWTVPPDDVPTFRIQACQPFCSLQASLQCAVLNLNKVCQPRCLYKATSPFEFLRLPIEKLQYLR